MQEYLEKYKKFIFLGILLIFIFLCYVAFFRVDNFLSDSPFREKKVELQGIQLIGYEDGKLSWSVKAKSAWSSYTIDYSNILNVYAGVIYDRQEKELVKNLQANSLRVNALQKRVNATGGVSALLCQKQKNVYVQSQQLQYFNSDQKSFLSGKVKVKEQDMTIFADSVQIDHPSKNAFFSGNILLKKAGTTITGQSMVINLDSEEGKVNNNVKLHRPADPDSKEEFKQKSTDITCADLYFKKVSSNTEIKCQGNLKIHQEDKQGIAKEGTFLEKQELLILQKNVSLIFEKSAWLLDENTVNKLKQQELKTALYEKLIILADNLELSTRSKDFTAQGNIRVTLKEKDAVSDTAVYQAKNKAIQMTGNVKLKKADGSWIKAEKVNIDIDQEIFSAEGKVESTVILKR